MSESSRNIESLFLYRLAFTTQKKVAEAIGTSESHVSRITSGELGLRLGQIGPAFEALGLRVVDADEVTIPADDLESMRRLASRYLEKMAKAP